MRGVGIDEMLSSFVRISPVFVGFVAPAIPSRAQGGERGELGLAVVGFPAATVGFPAGRGCLFGHDRGQLGLKS